MKKVAVLRVSLCYGPYTLL